MNAKKVQSLDFDVVEFEKEIEADYQKYNAPTSQVRRLATARLENNATPYDSEGIREIAKKGVEDFFVRNKQARESLHSRSSDLQK